jgi:transposase
MSLDPQVGYLIPEETVRVAQAAFPHPTLYMRMRDALGSLYSDQAFTQLFPGRGQPAIAPARLALVLVFQFIENLSDRQAADAVRGRIDWKYALALELTDPGFDASVLSEFRARLIAADPDQLLLKPMLTLLRDQGLLKAAGRARTDSTHVLAAIRILNRLTCVGETLRHALNVLAEQAPVWLQGQITPEWFERYSRRVEEYRLPKSETERTALAATIGTDGVQLLMAIYSPTAPAELRNTPAVEVLRQVWVQQYYAVDDAGVVRWRSEKDLPPGALLIVSPYDMEARLSAKRGLVWNGYKVHLTETCDEEGPHLLTHVATTLATTPDEHALPSIHAALAVKQMLPRQHIVDRGYVDSEQIIESQTEYGIEVLGPVPGDQSWQAHSAKGFENSCFAVDWDAQSVICPAGSKSTVWEHTVDRHGKGVVHIAFDRARCQSCSCRADCTRSVSSGRALTLRPREQHVALQAARQRQTTAEFKEQYATRAGIEGTLSQGIRAFELRQTRYNGLAKTHLQHILIAIAINLVRVGNWLQQISRAKTRQSHFAALAFSSPMASLAGWG